MDQGNQKQMKVLILAYDFPPYVSVGALRPFNWYKFFPQYGAYPIVVTRQWDNKYGNHLDYIAPGKVDETIVEEEENGMIIRSPYRPNLSNKLLLKHGENKFRLIRKIITGFYEFSQFILPVGPKKGIYKAAKDYLKSNEVDLIIATGDPFVLFRYASRLSSQFDVPWVADYRDPWSKDIYVQSKPLLRIWSQWNEKRAMRNASTFTTANEVMAEQIQLIIGKREHYVLPNGYDPIAIENTKKVNQSSSELRITYIGRIYDWYPIESFMRVFSKFIEDHQLTDVKLRFYGISNDEVVTDLINTKFKSLQPHVSVFPKMPNSDLMLRIAEDNVMLLFNTFALSGTKIYDYIGINRQIILCYEDDPEGNDLKDRFFKIKSEAFENTSVQSDILKASKAGIIVKDSDHLYLTLENLYKEFKDHGKIASRAINPEQFSRTVQIEKLIQIFQNIISTR